MWRATEVSSHEILEDFDIGLLQSESTPAKAFNWISGSHNLLDDVQTVGFPYAVDVQRNSIHIRAFKGYIVSNPEFDKLPTNPLVYELSFQCPRGLSGAPVFVEKDNARCIIGIVLGNQATDMLVFSHKEVIKEKA